MSDAQKRSIANRIATNVDPEIVQDLRKEAAERGIAFQEIVREIFMIGWTTRPSLSQDAA